MNIPDQQRLEEKQYRETLEQGEAIPDTRVWERLEKELPLGKSRKRIIYWSAGALVLLIVAGVIGIRSTGIRSGKQEAGLSTEAIGKVEGRNLEPGTRRQEAGLSAEAIAKEEGKLIDRSNNGGGRQEQGSREAGLSTETIAKVESRLVRRSNSEGGRQEAGTDSRQSKAADQSGMDEQTAVADKAGSVAQTEAGLDIKINTSTVQTSAKDSVAAPVVITPALAEVSSLPGVADNKPGASLPDSIKPGITLESRFLMDIKALGELSASRITSNTGPYPVYKEHNNTGLNAGVLLGVRISKCLEFTLGCGESQTTTEFPHSDVSFYNRQTGNFIFNSSAGDMAVPFKTMYNGFIISFSSNPVLFSCQYQYAQTASYLHIPLGLRWNCNKGSWKPYVSAGMDLQYLLSSEAILELIKEPAYSSFFRSSETDVIRYNSLDIRKINFAVQACAGIERKLAGHFGVFAETAFRYNIMPVSTDASVKANALFWNLGAGIRYRF
ncbi:MAG TPA: outer membrane beta-barrel protein [Bacteroidia bacterium]|jgi:hypothetical protein|nr:outer membrane beta-barrel protein [Bacteroidia bacterium]